MQKKIKINLGCGKDYREGFVNLDISPDIKADVTADVTKGLPFSNSSASYILALDLFEHLNIPEQKRLFREVYRVLDEKGIFQIRIPNYDDIIERFANNKEVRNYFLFGDSSQEDEFMIHKSSHTLELITAYALASGLVLESNINEDTNYILRFKKGLPRKIKEITYINQSLGVGGAESFHRDLFSYLIKNGIKINAILVNTGFEKMLKDVGVKTNKHNLVIDIVGNKRGFVKGVVLFPLAIFYYAYITYKSRNTDVIFLSGYIEKILVTPWAKLFGVPVAWIEHGPLKPLFNKFLGIPKILFRLVSKLPDTITFPSKHSFESNLSITGISPLRCRVIWDALNTPKIKETSVIKNLVVCVSRLEEGKGQDILIKSWPYVLKEIPSASLRIVGEGDFDTKLNKLIDSLNLKDKITLTGYVPSSLSEMSKAEVLVFPSLWNLEGFGMVTIEGMSLKKPVVAFNYGPTPEIINNGVDGILVDEKTPEALAKAIVRLLKDPKLRSQIGNEAYKKYIKNFTFKEIGKKYITFFEDAVASSQANKIIKDSYKVKKNEN